MASQTYGYVRRAILRLAREGMRAPQIARELRCNENYARKVLRYNRPSGQSSFSKPTLGYPTRRDAIINLHQQGKTRREIADLINISMGYVSAVLSEAGCTKRHFYNLIPIDADVLAMIQPEADRRNMPVKELVKTLIVKTAQDGLVNAIMDDAA
jgi:DNA-binding CsgD family transcriptional regulator